MIFYTSISGLGYAPDDEPEEVEEDYPNEDIDMERYYEDKFKTLKNETK